ncbi:MAG: IS1634 family transposase [Methanomicrobiales archaeon]|nr:IS1634 family transposase [Methanomicrobiales archaeon]
MAAIVYQTDKRSGITYAYRSVSYWDKEKKQSRAKRTLIGRVDSVTGKIVPTDGRNRKKREGVVPEIHDLPAPPQAHRSFCGATYLLDSIGEKLGITHDLQECFPETYRQILSIVYYLILEDSSLLDRFEKWASLHKHPYGKPIPPQHSSEVFAGITEKDRHRFFALQGERRLEEGFWVYGTTILSSYSETLHQVQHGRNKEHDHLPQLKLALVFGEESSLPFYYQKIAGNIVDSRTIRHSLSDLKLPEHAKIKLVMDSGCYSEDNINRLLQDRMKFLVSARISSAFVRTELDRIYDTVRNFENYSEDYELYCKTLRTTREYTQKRPHKGDTLKERRRIYIHYYYNIDRAADDEKAFDRWLFALKREFEAGERVLGHEELYQKYFTIRATPGHGTRVSVKEEAIREAKRYYGFSALITNEPMDAVTALELYRNRDIAEKAFNNLKERLNMRRTLVSSEQNLDGKLFVQFVALIYLSYIKKQMQVKGLFKDYTLPGLLDSLDLIECLEQPGKALRIGEIQDAQAELYHDLGVDPPASL